MGEAVRRSYAEGNPLAQLGLGRRNVRQKPAITDSEMETIWKELATRPVWMRDCFMVAAHQGCRLSETEVPLDKVDLVQGTIQFRSKGGKVFTTRLHPRLHEFVRLKIAEGAAALCVLPQLPAKAWHTFFREIKMPHLSFHCTRVTVITNMARKGVPQGLAQSFVGHASETVHRIYQRLTIPDLKMAADAIPGWP